MTNPLYDPYQILTKVYSNKQYLKQAIAETQIEESNRARTIKIVYGVLENDIFFDHCINMFANEKSPKLPVRILLKIATYMIYNMQKPQYMVTDNCVQLVKKLGKGGMSGFVNAYLRSFSPDRIPMPMDLILSRSLEYSYPVFVIERVIGEYDEMQVDRILEHREPITFVRFKDEDTANAYLANPQYQDKLQATEFKNLYAAKHFKRDEGFDKGEYTFQSIGSVAICDIVEKGEHLLEACAGPGGKSVLLSNKFKQITACELHPHRVELIEKYATRMHVDNVHAICQDSKEEVEAFKNAFDAVLIDAPCSGYGVVNANPDIKYFRAENDITTLSITQLEILKNCAAYVKKGGYLYYSTCSIFKAENDLVVQQFLEKYPEFQVEEITSPLAYEKKKFGLQFLPHISHGVGFYICKLKKV